MPGSAGAPVRSDPPVTSLRALYEAKLADGLRRDLEQEALVARLDDLRAELDGRPGALARLLPRRSAPRGVYVWGEVGRGKSMLVDALMATLGDLPARRIHFHAFMRDLHRALHDLRREGAADPIVAATDRVAGRAALLALDELEITDIVDAMIVGRVFERLLERRIALVVTSNRAPVDLYRDGLKRDLFLPFTRLIEDRLDVIRLDGGRDYRRQEGIAPDLYLTPEDGDVQRRIAAIWRDLPGETEDRVRFGASGALRRKGRAVRAGFDALCRRPVAAAAYLDLAAAADSGAARRRTAALCRRPRRGAALRAPHRHPLRRALRPRGRGADGSAGALRGGGVRGRVPPHREPPPRDDPAGLAGPGRAQVKPTLRRSSAAPGSVSSEISARASPGRAASREIAAE